MGIGKRIKQRRKFLKLTQEELAKQANISQPLLCGLEKELNNGSRFILSIARALKVNADWLETGTGDPELDCSQPHEEYPPLITELIKLMTSTDERGQAKVLIAAKDTVELHNAFKNSLPNLKEKEVIAAIIQQLSQKALSNIIKSEASEVNDVSHRDGAAPKNKNH